MMWGYGLDGGVGWFGMVFMMAFMALVFIGGVLLLVWFLRAVAAPYGSGYQPYAPPPRGDEALEIARQRYARGEISKEEYDEIRRALG